MAGLYDGTMPLIDNETGKQKKAKSGEGMVRWFTDPVAWGLKVPKEVSDICMGQGRETRWDVTKMRPVMLAEDYPQPGGKVLKMGTYIMATRNMKLRIVPSLEMRRKHGSAADAAREAQAKGLLPMKTESDEEMLESIRAWTPTYRLQVVSTGGADGLLLNLAESKWMSEDEKKVVRARIFRLEEEKGGQNLPHRTYDPSPLGAGEVVVEPNLPDGVKLGEAGLGAEEEAPLTAGVGG